MSSVSTSPGRILALTLSGNAICRVSQIDLNDAVTKENNAANKEIFTAGIYAPTIRYHGGVFYIICTNLKGSSPPPADEDFEPSNFYITSTDLTESTSFSDPIFFDFHGIDPSLLFDDDGKVYVQGSWIYGYDKSPATSIKQFEIDITTGKAKTPTVDIWGGFSGMIPEGPHMYKKDGYYYLLAAEGGTHRGHMATIARSKSPWGPFENCPLNPVLQAPTRTGYIQCVGHAELFQDGQGEWWAVMLARREYGTSYPMGRETFMVPVTWNYGDFPRFQSPTGVQFCERSMAVTQKLRWTESVALSHLKTLFLRSPKLEDYEQRGNSILMRPTGSCLTVPQGTASFVGQRQESHASRATVTIFPEKDRGSYAGGLTVYKDTNRHASIEWNYRTQELSLRLHSSATQSKIVSRVTIAMCSALCLRIESCIHRYKFSYTPENSRNMSSGGHMLGEVKSECLSGDDFTGTVFAIHATGSGQMIEFGNFRIDHDIRDSMF